MGNKLFDKVFIIVKEKGAYVLKKAIICELKHYIKEVYDRELQIRVQTLGRVADWYYQNIFS